MLLFMLIIGLYLLLLLFFLQMTDIHNVTIISVSFMILATLLYTKLIYYLPRKGRVVVNSFFVSLAFFLSVGNIVYYYIKGSFFTISQLSLLNELAGVTDSVTSYFKWSYLLFLLIPIVIIIVSNKVVLKESKHDISNKLAIIAIVLIGVVNLGFYKTDSLLYTTVYSPVEYAKEFGFISFYARELTPFTKGELNDVEYDNQATPPPTTKYSGMFKDKSNVVFVKAESFDDIAIDEQLTPTLYKMATDGMFFENYYTLTTNTNASEFSTLTSISPPFDYSQVENFSGNYTSIPEVFESAGYCTFGFHLNSGSYYNREQLYPEMYKFMDSYFSEDMEPGITMADAKDEIMFEDSIKYIEQQDCDKNFTYYMSIFGHAAYNEGSKPLAKENYQYVESIYPENDEYLNTYLSYQMSLDQMLEEMVDYYTEIGELADTIFIVVADHYPYTLGDLEHQQGESSKAFAEQSFSGEPYETYNVPFFIYDPTQKLDDNTKYISNIDILPTVADLFGLDYQYAEGNSAFDQTTPGVIKWYATEEYGMLSEDFVYQNTERDNQNMTPELQSEIEADQLFSAKLYSLF